MKRFNLQRLLLGVTPWSLRPGVLLVADGVLALDRLGEARISVQQLFTLLRKHGLSQLGEAKRVYLEAPGRFSVYRQDPARAGLSLAPSWDAGPIDSMEKAPGVWACSSCGTTRSGTEEASQSSCGQCHTRAWVPAIAGGVMARSGGQEPAQDSARLDDRDLVFQDRPTRA